MSDQPKQLQILLSGGECRDAWDAFVAEYSRLLLHVARSVTHSHDEAMDAYAFVLQRLREDDCRRLREFARNPRSKLSTWLVVVARRLCIDHYRSRFGRDRGNSTARSMREARRRLIALASVDGGANGEDVASPESSAEELIRERELLATLDDVLAALEPTDRLLIRLRFEDNLPAQEIARIMRLPSPFHVYRHLNALMAELRDALRRRGIENAAP